MLLAAILLSIYLATDVLIFGNNLYSWPKLIILFSVAFLYSDSVLKLVKDEDGVITKTLKGNLLAIPIVFLAGFYSCFLWEVLNTHFTMWNYILPKDLGVFLGIPIPVIIFGGTLNLFYWTLVKLLFKRFEK